MKHIKLILVLLLLFVIGVITWGNIIIGSKGQIFENTLNLAGGTESNSSLFLLFILPCFLLLFLVVFLGFVIIRVGSIKTEEHFLKNQNSMLANMETLSKTMLEQRQLAYTSAFFAQLPIIYQSLYDSVIKIVSYSFFFPERFKHENSDLFSFCRVFLAEVAKNPEMVIKIRQTFKKNEKIQLEMATTQIKYERFLKALKIYDRDQFVYQYINDGVVGEVMDILISSYEDVKTQYVAEMQEKEKEKQTEKFEEAKSEEETSSLLASISFE